jgi:hypothetical protein
MRARSHRIHLRQTGTFFQLRDAAGVHDRGTNIVDELFLNELLAIVNRIKHFSDGQRRCGVLPNQAKAFLQFRGSWILQPEQMKRLQLFARARCLDGSQPVMRVVQQMPLGPKLLAQPRKKSQNSGTSPMTNDFRWQAFFRRLMVHLATADTIGALELGFPIAREWLCIQVSNNARER